MWDPNNIHSIINYIADFKEVTQEKGKAREHGSVIVKRVLNKITE